MLRGAKIGTLISDSSGRAVHAAPAVQGGFVLERVFIVGDFLLFIFLSPSFFSSQVASNQCDGFTVERRKHGAVWGWGAAVLLAQLWLAQGTAIQRRTGSGILTASKPSRRPSIRFFPSLLTTLFGNDPSAGSPTERFLACAVSWAARLYLKQSTRLHPLPLSLWTFPISRRARRRGFAADHPL